MPGTKPARARRAVGRGVLGHARFRCLGASASTVVAPGGGGYRLRRTADALLFDPQTEGILLYAETVGDPRRFLPRCAAARTKPVVLLKAEAGTRSRRCPIADAVFDAAMRRAGTVRAKTHAQLFAAARILATH
jgi:acetyltransferase